MKENKKINLDFFSHLNYVLFNLEKDIYQANDLADSMYLELSKDKIIEYLNYVYANIKCWRNAYETRNFQIITEKYKEIESIVSELELCLAELDNKFHIEGISYSIFQIGKILSDIKKESDKNGR